VQTLADHRSNIKYMGPTQAGALDGPVDGVDINAISSNRTKISGGEISGGDDTAPASTADEWARRPGGAADAYLRTRQQQENFPVALRALPKTHRRHLAAVYDVARVIDDLGDQAPGDRVALLKDFGADMAVIWQSGEPRAQVLRRLAGTVAESGLTERPFRALIEANLQDQVVTAYPAYEDLVAYCELSANPIGHMVLEEFGASTPENVELSDRVCTALQIIEHCQDVAEDRRNGRIYMPIEDMDRFGVTAAELDTPSASEGVRALVRFEAQRASSLLESGRPLLANLRGWARVAVTGYIAGGRAALISLKRVDWDVLRSAPHTRRLDVIGQLIAVTTGRKAAL
jgi:squalene synthase HpnC